VFGEGKPLQSLIPLELFRNPLAALSLPAPGSPSPTAAPF
jgi:hypothetical protein